MFVSPDLKIEAYIKISRGFENKLRPYIVAETTIIVIGGDGTMNAVASLLVNKNAILAPLPGGTLNHFTKDLGVEQDLEQAISYLASSSISRIDTARVNGQVFLNNSSIGIYPASLRAREETQSMLGKWLAAVLSSIKAIIRVRPMRLSVDGTLYRTPFIFVGNNQYKLDAGAFGQRYSLSRGILSVAIIETRSIMNSIKLILQLVAGRTSRADDLVLRQMKSTNISWGAQTSVDVSLDGEVLRLQTPLSYEILPKSIRVLVAKPKKSGKK